jgi:excisionase family DNA binding protein
MTAKQAAADLQISLSFVYKLMDAGEIAFERRGRRRLPVDSSVAEYKARNLVPATPKQHRPVKGPPYQFQHLFQGKATGR